MKNKLTYSKITCAGKRKINEDSIGVFCENKRLGFVLCDGLGGHGLGDVASSLTVNVFSQEMQKNKKGKKVIIDALKRAQEDVLAEQKKQNATSKIKTTAVMAVVDERHAFIGHIGDSRLYIFRDNKIFKRTLDHSIPQMLALTKEITEKEIRNHPERNILLRVIGTDWQQPQYEIMKPIPLRKIQAMLLCSDGFWEFIDDEAMCQCLEDANSVEEWLKTMTSVVEINGTGRDMDNFSAIAVWNENK